MIGGYKVPEDGLHRAKEWEAYCNKVYEKHAEFFALIYLLKGQGVSADVAAQEAAWHINSGKTVE